MNKKNNKTGFDSFFDDQMMDDNFRQGYEKIRSEIDAVTKEKTLALQLLHDKGLAAQESNLRPGDIIGGTKLVETEYGNCFEDAFMIHACNGTYYVTILCEAYSSLNEPFSSIEDAVKHIINVYSHLEQKDYE